MAYNASCTIALLRNEYDSYLHDVFVPVTHLCFIQLKRDEPTALRDERRKVIRCRCCWLISNLKPCRRRLTWFSLDGYLKEKIRLHFSTLTITRLVTKRDRMRRWVSNCFCPLTLNAIAATIYKTSLCRYLLISTIGPRTMTILTKDKMN